MSIETKLLLTCLGLLGFGLVLAVTRVLGAWTEHHVSRHNLIVESKQRRYDYLKAVYDRDQAISAAEAGEADDAYDSVIIEEPGDTADAGEPAEPRLAA
ncbi:MAG: hypothetical protein ACPGYV_08520 [Phycisphaeraceae bacterium]